MGRKACRYRSILEWVDASKHIWIDQAVQARVAEMDSNEKKYIDNMKIVYQTGNGNNHLMPVLIPKDKKRQWKS